LRTGGGIVKRPPAGTDILSPVFSLIPLFALGAGAGALGVLLGVGGGLIIVPALTLWMNFSLQNAIPASLLCVAATSVAGSTVNLSRGRVELGPGIELQFYTVFGAVAAALIAAWIPAAPLHFAFAALLVYAAYRMCPRRTDRPVEGQSDRRGERPGPRAAMAAAGASVGAGLLSGLLGVGGGIVNTPVLHLVLGLPFERAAATSVYMIGLTAASSSLIYLARGDVLPDVTGATVLGALAGSWCAAKVSHRLNTRALKVGFALLLVYVAFRMVQRGLSA